MSLTAAPPSLLSRRDIAFLLYEWLDVESLTARARYSEGSREIFDEVLSLAERVAGERFASHNKKADSHEPSWDGERIEMIPEIGEALDAFASTGLLGAALPQDAGGMQLPHVVSAAAFAWFQAANIGTAGYPFLTLAAANLLLAHGSSEQVKRWVTPMLEGRFFGTMSLSETQAGSSLADVSTRAEPQTDGSYRVFGSKMWISGGEHDLAENIVHLVLAKLPGGPPGVKGISLFIVPKFVTGVEGQPAERNDVVLAGLNHKMGYRATTNTLLSFGEGAFTPDDRPGAVGFLVGEPHRGLTYMFHMMNEARIGVGAGAMALGYTGYLKSLQYARERLQGRPVGSKDPRSAPVAIIEHADVRRMLLAQKSYVEGACALVLYAARLVDEQVSAETAQERAAAGLLLDVLTPIVKSWPSQWCLEANSLAIQVHGGYGYAREYDVEQHYRDNRLNQIHEGTHGIQALDLLGRKVVMQDGAGLAVLGQRVGETVRRARGADDPTARELGDQLATAMSCVSLATTAAWATGEADLALANASLYLEATGHVVLAWMWLEQLLAAAGRSGDFYAGKRQAARWFFRHELPRVEHQLSLVAARDRIALDMKDAWF